MTDPHHRSLRLGLAGALAVTLVGAALQPTHAAPTDRFPDRIELPDGFQPEGIATGRGPTAFVGSLRDGDVYRIDLRTGAGAVVVQGPGTPSVGLATDRRGRLFVAGGEAGDARVVNPRTGALLADYQLTAGASFVNDVVITREAAWFTDSANARLFRLPLAPDGALPDPSEIETVPLTGEWVQGSGFGANGIEQTPDRAALLVVNSSTGTLYRVDPASGVARAVDLGGSRLTNGDGLLLHGRALYAVLNRQNRVAVVELDPAGTSGRVTRFLTSPDFDVPTTVARFGSRLYLPNARFGTPPTPQTEYWVTQVPARR